MSRVRQIVRVVVRLLLIAMTGLLIVLAYNTWQLRSHQIQVPPAPVLELPEQAVLDRFAESLSIPTISHANPARIDAQAFEQFKTFLEASFPLVHQHLTRMTGMDFGDDRNQSLLFKWEGDPTSGRHPILLMGHYDVVPVGTVEATQPAEEQQEGEQQEGEQQASGTNKWTHPPFSGTLDDQYVWGRGAIDDKCAAIGMMEAVEQLLSAGFEPYQTIYFSLGHDEEVGGLHGNKPISQWMRLETRRLEYVLDEGGGIFNDFAGLDQPAAFVGIGEKGFVTIELKVDLNEAGHASMPGPIPETAIGILGEALQRLHRHPLPARLDGGVGLTLDYIGPEMSLINRIGVANRWLFKPLLVRQLSRTPLGNAALRTTIAPTIIEGGEKDNVLPAEASLTLNLRVHQKDSVQSAVDHIEAILEDLPVDVEQTKMQREASRLSSTESDSFAQLHRTIREIYPSVVVAPFVVVAGTDASHYDDSSFSDNVYRFVPWRLGKDDLKRIHGFDERLSRKDYLDIVRFYERLIRNTAAPQAANSGVEAR